MIKFKNICPNLKNLWVTGCVHMGHKNICKGVSSWEGEGSLGCRDFETLEQMNQTLVDNINKYVKESDVLIQLGDWSFGGIENISKFRNQLNVKTIHAVEGNHDFHLDELKLVFTTYQQLLYAKCEGIELFCSHYPCYNWHQSHKGSINLHSHTHNSFEHQGKGLDCGVDSAFAKLGEYRPFNMLEILDIIGKKQVLYNSHHNKNTN